MAELVPVVQYCVREYTTPEAMIAFLILESYVELKKLQSHGATSFQQQAQTDYTQDEKRRFLLALFSVLSNSNMSQSLPTLVSTLQRAHRARVSEALLAMKDRKSSLCDRLLVVARYDEKDKDFRELQRFFTMNSFAGIFFRRVIVAFNSSSFEQVAALQVRLLDYASRLGLLDSSDSSSSFPQAQSKLNVTRDSSVHVERTTPDFAQSLRSLNWTAATENAHRQFDILQQGAATHEDFVHLLRCHNLALSNGETSSTSLNTTAFNQARSSTLSAFATLNRAKTRRAYRFGMLQHAALAHVFGFHARAAACLSEARRYAAECADATFAALVREWSAAILLGDGENDNADAEHAYSKDDELLEAEEGDASVTNAGSVRAALSRSLGYPQTAVVRLLDSFATRWTSSFSTAAPADAAAGDHGLQHFASSSLNWTVVSFPAAFDYDGTSAGADERTDAHAATERRSAPKREVPARCCVGESSACRFARVRLIVQLYAALASLWDSRGHRFMQLACAHSIIALCECAAPTDDQQGERAFGRTDRKLCSACAASVHIMRVFALAIFVRSYTSMSEFDRAARLLSTIRDRLFDSFSDTEIRSADREAQSAGSLFENVPIAIGVRESVELLERTYYDCLLERELSKSCSVSSLVEQALANLRLLDHNEANLRAAWLQIRTGEHQAALDLLDSVSADQSTAPVSRIDATTQRIRSTLLRAELFVRARNTRDARKCVLLVERLAAKFSLSQFSVAAQLIDAHCSITEGRIDEAIRCVRDTLQTCPSWTLSDSLVANRLVHTLAISLMEQFRVQNWHLASEQAKPAELTASISCRCQLESMVRLLEHVRRGIQRGDRPCPVQLVRTLVHQATVFDWLGEKALRNAKAKEARRQYLDNTACFNSDIAMRPSASDSVCLIDILSH